jgi:hypothetical protein
LQGRRGTFLGCTPGTKLRRPRWLNMIVSKKRNPRIGGSLDDFLKEEGIFEETQAQAVKELPSWQLEKAVKKKRATQRGKTEKPLAAGDAKRDLGAELLQAVREMKAGKAARAHRVQGRESIEARTRAGRR